MIGAGIHVLLCFTLLYFADIAFSSTMKQEPPPAKRLKFSESSDNG